MTTKYLFFTGGVVSSVGKGVTAAALGLLLKERGFKIAVQKLDPYINVDPGTMSPYQHGEVFVTDDGWVTDQDIGNYERFLNEDFSGAIGGGNAFLHRLEEFQHVELLPPPIRLEVYTRDVIKDASDWSLSRDTAEYKKRRQAVEAKGNPKPKNPLRFPWTREL